ncbi:MAG: carbohydrate kinase family protein [Chloroflexota bacterium]
MKAIVIGNTTLDVLCYHVDEVPRHDSLVFEHVLLCPGGCGSNVAIGLQSLGVNTALVTTISDDDAYATVEAIWQQVGLDTGFVRRVSGAAPAVSIGLVDSAYQPRFIHTPGANHHLTSLDLAVDDYIAWGAQALMVAGFFVLPGLLDGNLPAVLADMQQRGILTFMDVANAKRMDEHPGFLWDCLPHLDYFVCNTPEAQRLSGKTTSEEAAKFLRMCGARTAIVKLGAAGCWAESEGWSGHVPGVAVAHVIDTTGAGDAFAAGLIAATLAGKALPAACAAANAAGARMVSVRGAISAWLNA